MKPGSPPPNLGGECPEPHFALKCVVPQDEGIGIILVDITSLTGVQLLQGIHLTGVHLRQAYILDRRKIHLRQACSSYRAYIL